MLKKSYKQLSGNDQYEGFCVDLIEEISKENENFTVKLIIGTDGKSGNLDKTKNPPEWTGLIGYIKKEVSNCKND